MRLDNVHVLRAREVRISADRPFVVYADGDPIATLPALVRALPGAVRVLVPPAVAAAPRGSGALADAAGGER